jgi:hypothetical protein
MEMDAMRRALRALALLAMMVSVTGCFAWQTVGALPTSADLPADTRITKYDGTTITLAQSRIENDTIRGYVDGSHFRHVIPLAAVDLIEAKQLQPKQSVIAGVLVGGLVYVVVRGLQTTRPFGPIPGTP